SMLPLRWPLPFGGAIAPRRTAPGRIAESLLPLLVLAAVGDWLITRTLTRAFIFMPKPDGLLAVYHALNRLGRALTTLTAWLAWLALLWLVFVLWQRRERITAVLLGGFALWHGLFMMRPPGSWLLVGQALGLLVVGALAARAVRLPDSQARLAVLFPAAALIAAALYQIGPTLAAWQGQPEPPVWSLVGFRGGEILVVLGAGALWWAYGRGARHRHAVFAAAPAVGFSAAFLAAPAMTAVLTVWSTGLTLFLPWPVYALALWLAGVTALVNWRRRPGLSAAVLLLAAAGYAPQLNTQWFLALVALFLLAFGMAPPPSTDWEDERRKTDDETTDFTDFRDYTDCDG
ncbi:MAG: hypothetical protein NZP34_03460, partial [Caldilineales bacterium]|nr:hypothetical protein [Caldilineales bacterium]